MKRSMHQPKAPHVRLGIASLAALGLLLALPGSAQAAQPTVGLGTASTYAVLAGTTVTNTGSSIVSGDLGVNPGTAVTGFPPGIVRNGTVHIAGPEALRAQSDLTIAFDSAAGRTPVNVVSTDLGGQTLVAGVYKATSIMNLTGTVTLNAQNDPNAVFIFQAATELIAASSSSVNLINGASSCNVFWQVGASATIGSGSTFRGSVLALTSISLADGATVDGRVLARNGGVTMITNTITRPACAAATPTSTATPTSAPTVAPAGAVASGDGSTSGGTNDQRGLLTGVLLVAGLGGAAVAATRRRRRLNS